MNRLFYRGMLFSQNSSHSLFPKQNQSYEFASIRRCTNTFITQFVEIKTNFCHSPKQIETHLNVVVVTGFTMNYITPILNFVSI